MKRENKNIWYTWCNYQKENKRIYCRLDRFYANEDFFSFDQTWDKGREKVYPFSLFDHHPIKVKILIANDKPKVFMRKKKIILNNSLLKNEDCNEAVFTLREINKWMLKDMAAIEI